MWPHDNPDPDSVQAQDSVEIHENMGEWFVVVVRDGKEQVTSFDLESYARAYAEGQRLGMGLKTAADGPSRKSVSG